MPRVPLGFNTERRTAEEPRSTLWRLPDEKQENAAADDRSVPDQRQRPAEPNGPTGLFKEKGSKNHPQWWVSLNMRKPVVIDEIVVAPPITSSRKDM